MKLSERLNRDKEMLKTLEGNSKYLFIWDYYKIPILTALCLLVVLGKGILAGLAAGAVYKLIAKWNAHVAMLCAAIVCPVVNTGVFICCMLTFFKDVLAAWAGGGDIIAYILSGLVLLNFVPELIINVVFGTVGHTVIHVVKRK